MVNISKKGKTTKGSPDNYTISFNSEVPTAWRHRTTKWTKLYNAMDTLMDDTNDNVRINLDSSYTADQATQAFNNIRSAMYRWAVKAELPNKYRVFTAANFEKDGTPFIVGWIGEKE